MTAHLRAVDSEPDGVEDTASSPPLPGRRLVLGAGYAAGGRGPTVTLDLDGEQVVSATVEIGRTHRGVEKLLESRPWYHAVPYAEGIAPESGALAATALCHAVEALLALELPERAQWLRVLIGELGRVRDHLMRLSATCAQLGASGPSAWLRGGRDRVSEWQTALTGAAVASHFVRLGGVSRPLSDGLADELRDVVADVEAVIDDVERSVGRLRGFVHRLRDVGVLDREACLRRGVTGVLLRAAGDAFDLRRTQGYSVYPEIDFDVVVGTTGDNYDRFLVCLGEVRQSLGIVGQCLARLDALGEGPVRSPDPRIAWPSPRVEPQQITEVIHHAMGVIEGPQVPVGDAYAAVEGANGELGFYVVSEGGPLPVRIRCRAPGFFHASALPGMLRGAALAEVGTTLALANLDSSECDR